MIDTACGTGHRRETPNKDISIPDFVAVIRQHDSATMIFAKSFGVGKLAGCHASFPFVTAYHGFHHQVSVEPMLDAVPLHDNRSSVEFTRRPQQLMWLWCVQVVQSRRRLLGSQVTVIFVVDNLILAAKDASVEVFDAVLDSAVRAGAIFHSKTSSKSPYSRWLTM